MRKNQSVFSPLKIHYSLFKERVFKELRTHNSKLLTHKIHNSLFKELLTHNSKLLTHKIHNSLFKELITHNSKLITHKIHYSLFKELITHNSKLITLSLLFTLCSFFSAAQNSDSLKLALKKAKHDTSRCTILNEIVEAESDVKIWPVYNEQLFNLAKTNLQSSKITSNQTLFYKKHLADALNNFGYLAQTQGNIIEALNYFHKSIKIQEEISDKEGIATSLNNLGAICDRQGNILEALDYYYKSLKIQEEIKNKQGIANSLNNIGFIYDNQGEITKALEYYHKSIIIREEIHDKEGIANSLNNIGAIYSEHGDPLVKSSKSNALRAGMHKALDYYHKSLKIQEEIQDKEGIANSLNNIGAVYKNEGDFSKVLSYYYKSLKVYEEIQDKKGIAYSKSNLADIYYKQNNIKEAVKFANGSMQIARELGYPEQIKSAVFILKKIFKKQNKFKEAFEMYELEILMRDSLSNTATKRASIKKQFQYQYEKKAAADSVKNAEEQKVKNAQLSAQTAQLQQERTQRLALYGGLLLVIAFSAFVYNRFKVTQNQKGIIENQKHEVDSAYHKLHAKNKEVIDSIHYAAKIQHSLLTSEKYIAKEIKRLRKF